MNNKTELEKVKAEIESKKEEKDDKCSSTNIQS